MDKESQEYKDYRKKRNETQRKYYEKKTIDKESQEYKDFKKRKKSYNKQYHKKYYEKISTDKESQEYKDYRKRKNEKHICDVCGGKYSNSSKAKHFKTNKHLSILF